MNTIWKYDIPIQDTFRIDLPIGCQILTVQVQNGKPCIWVRVDSEKKTHPKLFRLAGTGHDLGDTTFYEYIGSFQLLQGRLVYHLFEM